MLRSLVGSEMCIRDRDPHNPAHDHEFRGPGCRCNRSNDFPRTRSVCSNAVDHGLRCHDVHRWRHRQLCWHGCLRRVRMGRNLRSTCSVLACTSFSRDRCQKVRPINGHGASGSRIRSRTPGPVPLNEHPRSDLTILLSIMVRFCSSALLTCGRLSSDDLI